VDATAITLPNLPQSRHQALRLNTTRATKHRVNLFVANAAETPNILSRFPPKQWSMYYNIGYWIWELENIPAAWIDQLRAFNEVWTPSDFATRSITSSPLYQKGATKILTMNLGSQATPESESYLASRPRFNFPSGTLVFLVMLNAPSFFQRENPFAAVEAFERAFGRHSPNVLLVIKCNSFGREFEELRAAVNGSSSMRLMTDVLNTQELRSLLGSVDVLVSLHRSESYGLALLESLMLGKPVIATAYGGNMDFMSRLPTDFHFLLIPHGYVPFNLTGALQDVTSDQRWAEPDVVQAARAMSKLAADQGLLEKCRQVVGPLFREQFGFQAVGDRIKARLEAIAAITQAQRVTRKKTKEQDRFNRSKS
ncbi:unnamed protein product, partial [Symbiodinium sp. CCMP2456]